MRIVALFTLKPSVVRERYETWARTTDMPTVQAFQEMADLAFMLTEPLGAEVAA